MSQLPGHGGDAPPLRRLNWGCGSTTPLGWVNSDLKDEPGVDLAADIRDGLPVPDDTFDYIVSIHALPMISLPDLVPTLQELRRMLKPGGTLRLSLPDLDRGMDAYRRGERDYFLVPDDDAESIGAKFVTQLLWYGWSVTVFTADFACELLDKAGFCDVAVVSYRETTCALPGITDLDNREHESLFVEAVKPG